MDLGEGDLIDDPELLVKEEYFDQGDVILLIQVPTKGGNIEDGDIHIEQFYQPSIDSGFSVVDQNVVIV